MLIICCQCPPGTDAKERCDPSAEKNQWPLDVRFDGELPTDLKGWTIIFAENNDWDPL